jgi:hypothetical protein
LASVAASARRGVMLRRYLDSRHFIA